MAVGSTRSTGTGINVPEIVSGLMEVERQPVTKLQGQIDQKTLVISTLGVFKSKVAALESAAKAIQTPGVYSIKSTTSSDATKVSATASNAATAGAYTVKVAQTAQSETSMIGGFASASQVLNLSAFSLTTKQGTANPVVYSPVYAKIDQAGFSSGEKIVFTLNGGSEQSFSVTTQTTPTAVASAINSAVTAGTLQGVTASVDAEGDLQLSSSNPLQGLTASIKTPGYATFGVATVFNAGDTLKFSVSGGSEQQFVITTQNTAAKVAAAINTAVTAGNLSAVSASVTGAGELKISAADPTKSVTAISGATAATSTAAASGTVAAVSTGLSTTASVSNVANWINALSAGLEATLVQRADGKFALNVSSKETGAANAFSISGISTSDFQKDKVTLSGTFAVDDAIVLSINGKPFAYKVTANDLTANGNGTGGAVLGNSATALKNIAASIASAYNAAEALPLRPVTATADAGVITLTASSAGTGFTATSQVAKKLAAVSTLTANGTGVKQIDQIQLSGTYAVGDVISLTINGTAVSHTVTAANLTGAGGAAISGSSAAAYTNIATSIVAALSTNTAVNASVSGTNVDLTAKVAGTGFTTVSSITPAKPNAIRAASIANSSSPLTAQVDTVALSGKYSAGDTLTVTVGGVPLSYTVKSADVAGGGDTADDYERIAQGFVIAYNASSNTAHTPVTASSSGKIISLTADVAGSGFIASAVATSPAVAVGSAIHAAVVANVSERGLTAVGGGAIGGGTIANGTYTATYDGAAWLVSAPSGTFSATLAAGTLTLTNGANSLTVSTVAGTPKTGDRVSIVVAGSSPTQTVTPALTEHAAIELQSSRDAFFSINGTAVQRSSNQVEDVISGVTFNLNSPVVPAGGAISSLAGADFSSATSTVINVSSGAEDLSSAAVEDFVKAYNELLTFYKTESVSSTDPKKRGVLNSDSTLRTFMERIRGLYARGIRLADGSDLSFSAIGVEVQRDGSIFLDKGKLNNAVANGLQDKFSAGVTLGYESSSSNLTSFITASLRKTGMISGHVADAEGEQTRLEQRVSDWEVRLTRIQDRYYRQYAALDALLFRLQTTSNALTSAIDSLVNSQKSG